MVGVELKRILIVDDDEGITDYLRRGLSYEGFLVEVANSGEEALSKARQRPPDLVVLDWMMPGMDGIEVLKRIRLADQNLPVIFLTAKDAPADQVLGFQSGADDFVVKPVPFEVLLARVQARLRSRESAQPNLLQFADIEMNLESHTLRRRGQAITLTAQEFRLLHAFMDNPDRVLSKTVLLDRVWGNDFFGDSNVVEVYIRQLRQKLGEPSLIQTVRGVGYVLRQDEA